MKKIMALILIAVLIAAAADATVRGKREPGSSYTGLSSDTKPTTSTFPSLWPGETFTETDTGYKWLYNGSTWVLQFGVAASDTMRLTAVGTTPAWCSIGYDSVKFIMKTTGADSTTFQVYGKKNPGGLTAIGDSIKTGGDAEITRDYAYPGHFDSLYVGVVGIQGTLTAARIQIVGKKSEK